MNAIINSLVDGNNQSSKFINDCLLQYEDKLDQQGQFSDYDHQQQNIQPDQLLNDEQSLKYYGYEDKKSITIKPIKMHKDLISLKKENQQKKEYIQELEKQNYQLKQKYHSCINQNKKVQKFLKDIQFTFKNDKKSQKANQIMLKAKRMLYRQAKQCQNNAKKITKSAQANTVQQIKMYIEFLEAQKVRIKKQITVKKKQNQKLMQEQDFNAQNEQKFQTTMLRVQKMLNIQMQRTARHHEIYKIQKGSVSTGLKQKQIMLKKRSIQKYYQKLKDLMLKQEGQQYEIIVLEKKRKDKIKLIDEMKQFKSDIMFKKTSIQQLEKQLKQKLKTYDYMSKWTKQLKVKLEQKKQNHIGNKITYQKKINALSRQFEEWNKKYKMQLAEQQFGNLNGISSNGAGNTRKKGNTAKQIYFGNKDLTKQGQSTLNFNTSESINKRLRLVKIEEIRKIVKKIKLWILQNQIDLQYFIKDKILNWKQVNSAQNNENNKSIEKNEKNVSFLNQASKTNSSGDTLKLLPQKDRNLVSGLMASNVKMFITSNGYSESSPAGTQASIPQISLLNIFQSLKAQFLILNQQADEQILKLARYVVEDNLNSANLNSIGNSRGFTNVKTANGMLMVSNLSISKKIAFTILYKLLENELKTYQDIEETRIKFKQFLIKFYDPFRYDILMMLLSLDGLKGLKTCQSITVQNQSIGAQRVNCQSLFPIDNNKSYQTAQLRKSTNSVGINGSMNVNNLKKNYQLHLQLELDESVLQKKLQKHVVEQFYVVRYKQLIDLMICRQFREIYKPRLGMFDKICEIITGKKLIKENVTRQYNFQTIIDCTAEKKNQQHEKDAQQQIKTEQNYQQLTLKNNEISKTQSSNQGQYQVIDQNNLIDNNKNQEQNNYWIVPQKKISKIDIKIQDELYTDKFIRKGEKKKRTWLDDLVSDDENQSHERQSDFSNEDF